MAASPRLPPVPSMLPSLLQHPPSLLPRPSPSSQTPLGSLLRGLACQAMPASIVPPTPLLADAPMLEHSTNWGGGWGQELPAGGSGSGSVAVSQSAWAWPLKLVSRGMMITPSRRLPSILSAKQRRLSFRGSKRKQPFKRTPLGSHLGQNLPTMHAAPGCWHRLEHPSDRDRRSIIKALQSGPGTSDSKRLSCTV